MPRDLAGDASGLATAREATDSGTGRDKKTSYRANSSDEDISDTDISRTEDDDEDEDVDVSDDHDVKAETLAPIMQGLLLSLDKLKLPSARQAPVSTAPVPGKPSFCPAPSAATPASQPAPGAAKKSSRFSAAFGRLVPKGVSLTQTSSTVVREAAQSRSTGDAGGKTLASIVERPPTAPASAAPVAKGLGTRRQAAVPKGTTFTRGSSRGSAFASPSQEESDDSDEDLPVSFADSDFRRTDGRDRTRTSVRGAVSVDEAQEEEAGEDRGPQQEYFRSRRSGLHSSQSKGAFGAEPDNEPVQPRPRGGFGFRGQDHGGQPGSSGLQPRGGKESFRSRGSTLDVVEEPDPTDSQHLDGEPGFWSGGIPRGGSLPFVQPPTRSHTEPLGILKGATPKGSGLFGSSDLPPAAASRGPPLPPQQQQQQVLWPLDEDLLFLDGLEQHPLPSLPQGSEGPQQLPDASLQCDVGDHVQQPFSADPAVEALPSRTIESQAEADKDHDGRRRRIAQSSGQTEKNFACPFFQRNPKKYQKWVACPGPGWPEVHRVKYVASSPTDVLET
jgi:hypothetical protein